MFDWKVGLLTMFFEWHFMWVVFSIYVHRTICHGYFTLSSKLEHFFRFYSWATMGFAWENWMQKQAAKHRKHHAKSDSLDDPHSPFRFTFSQLLDVIPHQDPKRAYYMAPGELELYAPNVKTIDNWAERNIYQKHQKIGLFLYWIVLHTILFGWVGLILGNILYWGIKTNIITISVNYMFHKIGFRYEPTKGPDKSLVFFPIGIFFGGEELHAHHHNDPHVPYNHRYWFEFDSGWWWCRLFMLVGLMSLKNKN